VIIQYLADQWPEAVRWKYLPLHLACRTAGIPLETISYLIQLWPESIQVRDCWGYLPLHKACCNNNRQNADLIAFLIDKWPQAVREACPQTDALPLHLVCKAQQDAQVSLEVLKLLVEAWPDALLVQDQNGFLPLHYVCRNGKMTSNTEGLQPSLETIKLLVEPRPECLQIQTKLGMLPLHWACFDLITSTDVICYLVESYPKAAFVQDKKGRLPLHLACAQTRSDPPLAAIQCLVQAWPESVHIPQGEDNSDADSDYFSEDDSDDERDNGDHMFDDMQALALDLVCMSATSEIQRAQPLPELLLLLTNEIPPLHFACTLAWIPARLTTIQYMSTIYPNDRMRFHDGKLPFHHLCRAGAPRSCFEWWLEQCPEAISRRTTDTGDFPLHCFLSSSRMTIASTTTTELDLSINTQ